MKKIILTNIFTITVLIIVLTIFIDPPWKGILLLIGGILFGWYSLIVIGPIFLSFVEEPRFKTTEFLVISTMALFDLSKKWASILVEIRNSAKWYKDYYNKLKETYLGSH